MLAQDTHKSLYALKSTYILPVEEHASPQHADLYLETIPRPILR